MRAESGTLRWLVCGGYTARRELHFPGEPDQSRLHRLPADPGLPRHRPGARPAHGLTFGASALTDAFNVAFRIPNLLRRLFAEGAFSQAFVPVLAATKASTAMRPPNPDRRVATVLAWALLLTCVVGVRARRCWSGRWPAGCSRTPKALTPPC
jgi:hypothetical protein